MPQLSPARSIPNEKSRSTRTPAAVNTTRTQNRLSVLDDYKPYLDDRWTAVRVILGTRSLWLYGT